MKNKNKIFSLLVAFTFVIATFFMSVNVQAQTIYKGIDIYNGNGVYNWQAIKDNGVKVIIHKATEGTTFVDKTLASRYQSMVNSGFKVGYYHFARNTGNPEQQAQHFLNVVGNLHSDTVLWLDIENQPGWSKSQAIDYTNRFINYTQSKGYKIGVYTGLSFYYEYLQGNIQDVPMWLASYGRQPLQFPSVVSWQYSETGSVPGITGYVDMDYFNDSIFTGVKPNIQSNISQNTSNVQFWDSYNVSKVKSLQHLINGLGLANLSEDGKLGSKTLSAMKNLPVAKIKGYHNDAYTDWIEVQLGQSPDHIYSYGMDNTVRSFQKSKGLDVDGKVGINTLKELLK